MPEYWKLHNQTTDTCNSEIQTTENLLLKFDIIIQANKKGQPFSSFKSLKLHHDIFFQTDCNPITLAIAMMKSCSYVLLIMADMITRIVNT